MQQISNVSSIPLQSAYAMMMAAISKDLPSIRNGGHKPKHQKRLQISKSLLTRCTLKGTQMTGARSTVIHIDVQFWIMWGRILPITKWIYIILPYVYFLVFCRWTQKSVSRRFLGCHATHEWRDIWTRSTSCSSSSTFVIYTTGTVCSTEHHILRSLPRIE